MLHVCSIFCLPASRLSYCSYPSWDTKDELLDEATRDGAPTLLQRLTKPIPLLLSLAVVVVSGIVLKHALPEVPPKVLNRVEVRRIC